MAKALIKLAYRKVIDELSVGILERYILRDSYAEFLLKSQAYNPNNQFKLFSEIVAKDGRANSLHYKTSFAVLHHIKALKDKIPGLKDATESESIPFIFSEFKLIESSLSDKSLHKVAITFITNTFTLMDSFGDNLIIALRDHSETGINEIETITLPMQPGLSIISYQDLAISKRMIPAES